MLDFVVWRRAPRRVKARGLAIVALVGAVAAGCATPAASVARADSFALEARSANALNPNLAAAVNARLRALGYTPQATGTLLVTLSSAPGVVLEAPDAGRFDISGVPMASPVFRREVTMLSLSVRDARSGELVWSNAAPLGENDDGARVARALLAGFPRHSG